VPDPDTQEPTDELAPNVIKWCQSLGSDATTVTDILGSGGSAVIDAIEKGISEANSKAISRAQLVQKWTILPSDFSVAGGELGPTLKLKRLVICRKYAKAIETLYSSTTD